MNVLMFNYEYPPVGGGGGVINKALAEELARRHRIILVTSRFKGLRKREVVEGVEVIRVPVLARRDRNQATVTSMLSFVPSSLLAGFRLLRKERIDLVHSMFAVPSAPSGFLLAKLFGRPHIVSILGGDIYDPSRRLSPHRTPVLRGVVRLILNASDRAIGMSSDILARARRHMAIRRDLDLIPHGIQRPVFQEKSRRDLGLAEDETVLITVGRLISRKSVDELVRLVGTFQDGHEVRLLVIGDGPQRTRLQELAGELSVGGRVEFLGNVSEERKFQLLSASDIYVSTAQHEGFGLVFLEAMAVGLPIVSYNEGGQTDFLEDGKTGFLISVGDARQLAERVSRLIAREEERKGMGKENLKRVEQFLIEKCADRYARIYSEVCKGMARASGGDLSFKASMAPSSEGAKSGIKE